MDGMPPLVSTPPRVRDSISQLDQCSSLKSKFEGPGPYESLDGSVIPPKNWMVLLSSQKSGSTWVQRTLQTSPRMWVGDELMLRFSQRCRAERDKCKWDAVQQKLENIFTIESPRTQKELIAKQLEFYEKERELGKKVKKPRKWTTASRDTEVVGFKLQYDQIREEDREKFMSWIVCNNVTVVHLVKSAVVESFVSYQMELADIAQMGTNKVHRDTKGVISGKLASNLHPIKLDPHLASRYVRGVESQRDRYRDLFKYNSVGKRV
jgi:hypothetical protein